VQGCAKTSPASRDSALPGTWPDTWSVTGIGGSFCAMDAGQRWFKTSCTIARQALMQSACSHQSCIWSQGAESKDAWGLAQAHFVSLPCLHRDTWVQPSLCTVPSCAHGRIYAFQCASSCTVPSCAHGRVYAFQCASSCTVPSYAHGKVYAFQCASSCTLCK